jgi:hypothetical protein
MRRRKGDSIASGNAHKKLAKTLILARAERALQDSDDLERQATALVEQLRNARIGETLRKHGENSRGRPRKATTDDLRAAVLEMHEHSPHLTKTQVVERVRKLQRLASCGRRLPTVSGDQGVARFAQIAEIARSLPLQKKDGGKV